MTLAIIQNASDLLAPGGRIFLGNVPNRRERVAFLRGHFTSERPDALARFVRLVRALVFVAFNPTDRIGYWYTPAAVKGSSSETFPRADRHECCTFERVGPWSTSRSTFRSRGPVVAWSRG